jgi:RNA polymerase sigma-70 factor (ECF subfamily)
VSSDTIEARAAFDRLLGELRPKLHRYCARMTGSVIDGEDVVQEALIKAIEASPDMGSIAHPEGWLFRIAHNVALDFLRRRARRDAAHSNVDPDMLVDPESTADDRQVATTAGLHSFMRLPATQRGCVILMDVLGYSLHEIGEVIDSSISVGEGRAPSRARAVTGAGPRARRSSTAHLDRASARIAGRLCRPLQRPRFRADP